MSSSSDARDNASTNTSETPSTGARIAAAAAIGVVCGLGAFVTTRLPGFRGQDFWVLWYGAHALLENRNPYTTIISSGGGLGFPYPLPAALLAVPLAGLSPNAAGCVYIALSCGALAYAVTSRAWWPLLMFLSGSMILSVRAAQLSPLLTVGLFAPSAMWVAALKPNIGLAMLAYRPSLRGAAAMLLFAIVSLIAMPSWPREWVLALRLSSVHYSPLLTTGGPLLLLALLRWRRPEARLLATMAVVPSSPIVYEALPLFIVPRNRREMIVLVVLSVAAYFFMRQLSAPEERGAFMARGRWVMLWALYIPTLVMILRRPNVDESHQRDEQTA